MKYSLITIIYLLFVCAVTNAQWVQTNLPNISVYSFAVSNTVDGKTLMFAGTENGVYSSTDSGDSWFSIGLTKWTTALAIMDTNLFAGTFNGVYRYIKNSNDWKILNNGLSVTPYCNTLLVCDTTLFAGIGPYIFRYSPSKSGSNWIKILTAENTVLKLIGDKDSNGNTELFASVGGYESQGYIYRSTNNGESWLPKYSVVSQNFPYWAHLIYSLAVSFPNKDEMNLFAGAWDGGGIFLSTNRGVSWTAVSNGLNLDYSINAFAVYNSNVFAGTCGNGVFLTTNNGANWEQVNSGLPSNSLVHFLTINESTLYAGLSNGGIWKRPLTEMITSVDEQKENLINDFNLDQNYPNPFNPSTRISWQSPVSGYQTLKVYDVLGNEVATLVDEYKEAGRYEESFDATRLSSGIYFYKLQSGNFVETKKMVLLK